MLNSNSSSPTPSTSATFWRHWTRHWNERQQQDFITYIWTLKSALLTWQHKPKLNVWPIFFFKVREKKYSEIFILKDSLQLPRTSMIHIYAISYMKIWKPISYMKIWQTIFKGKKLYRWDADIRFIPNKWAMLFLCITFSNMFSAKKTNTKAPENLGWCHLQHFSQKHQWSSGLPILDVDTCLAQTEPWLLPQKAADHSYLQNEDEIKMSPKCFKYHFVYKTALYPNQNTIISVI